MALTPEQKFHNAKLDFEIKMADREFEMREEDARAKNAWFRATYPEADEAAKATYGMNVIGRRCVCGIRYVE